MVIKEDSQFKLEFRNTILTLNHNVDLLVKKTANKLIIMDTRQKYVT